MPKVTHDSFFVTGGDVDTSVEVKTGDIIQTITNGKVWFSLAGPVLDADGEGWPWRTPDDYPAPNLRKNSSICRIGSNTTKEELIKFLHLTTTEKFF
jgi:hypothetical protein